MSKQQQPTSTRRREFLKTAGLGAGAAAAAVATTGVAGNAKATEPSAQAESYRETAHIKRYYDLAKQF